MNVLKPCPFCGNDVYVEKVPLWRTYNDGTKHGYFGCFEYNIVCENPQCRCQVNLGQNSTIYNDDKTARQNAIDNWNRRA